jgi:hypothetical protein
MRFWFRYWLSQPRLKYVALRKWLGTARPCRACAAGKCENCRPKWGCSCFTTSCDAAQAAEEEREREENNDGG